MGIAHVLNPMINYTDNGRDVMILLPIGSWILYLRILQIVLSMLRILQNYEENLKIDMNKPMVQNCTRYEEKLTHYRKDLLIS